MTRASALALGIALACRSSHASADEPSAPPACGGPGHPGIVLRTDGVDVELRGRIVEQLRAALAGRSFDLCDAPGTAGAIAELDVTGLGAREAGSPPPNGAASGVSVTLSARDQITDKRVSRDLDLRGIPEDGRALVIAQAADELLRASWAELLVADAPKPAREVPLEVTRAVPAPEGPPAAVSPRPPMFEVGAGVAIEHFGRGLTQLGPEVSLGVFPFARLGAVARAGVRSGTRADVATGSVDPSGVALALAVMGAALPRTGRLGLDAGAEIFVTRVHYTVATSTAALAHDATGTAVYTSALVRGWAVIVAPLRATLGVSLGAPIHTVRAVAADQTVASVSGILLGGELGVGGAW